MEINVGVIEDRWSGCNMSIISVSRRENKTHEERP